MERSKIQITGVDTQASSVHSPVDGSCMTIQNLRPEGNVGRHTWKQILDVDEVFKPCQYDIQLGSETSVLDTSARGTSQTSLFFSDDGLNLYVLQSLNETLDQYTLSTAWDITTASYSQSVNLADYLNHYTVGLFFNPSGTKFYLIDNTDNLVHQFYLDTAWDLSSVESEGGSFDVSGEVDFPTGLFISPDGLNLYVTDRTNREIEQYTLSTAWDISSSSYASKTFDVSTEDTNPYDIWISGNGKILTLAGQYTGHIHQYYLSTAWDISTASHYNSLDISSNETQPGGLFFNSDGTKLYIVGSQQDEIQFYDLSFELLGKYYEFNRWYVLIGKDENLYLYSLQEIGGYWFTDTQLFTYDLNTLLGASDHSEVVTEVSWSAIGGKLYLCIYGETYNFNLIFRIKDNTIYPNVIRPKYSLYEVTENATSSNSKTDFDNQFSGRTSTRAASGQSLPRDRSGLTVVNKSNTRAGGVIEGVESSLNAPETGTVIQGGAYPGILKNKDKYFGIIYAWKMPNGKYVKHTSPYIFKIAQQAGDLATITDYSTLTFDLEAEHPVSDADYESNIADWYDYMYPYEGDYEDLDLGMSIFMTVAKDTQDEAIREGTYFKIGDLSNKENTSFEWSDNEELISTGEVLNIDEYSHHVITSKRINDYKNNLALIQTVTNFAIPGWDYGLQGINGYYRREEYTGTGNYQEVALKVKIETEDGSVFYRIGKIHTGSTGYPPVLTTPDLATYPDQRATELEMYWYDTSNSLYYLVKTFELSAHPYLNIAFGLNTSYEPYYTPGNGDTELDFTVNDEVLVEARKLKISDISRYYFPLVQTYEFDDDIQNILDNSDSPGSQRFGDYPLYIACKNSILAAQSGSGILIATINTIVNGLGFKTPNSYDTYLNSLVFVSQEGIHTLQGQTVENIFDSVQDSLLASVDDDGVVTTENLLSAIIGLDDIYVSGSNHKYEILITGTGSNCILIYNIKHKMWYSFAIYDNDGNLSNTVSNLLRINNKVYAEIDDYVYEWGQGENDSLRDKFLIITNPMVLNDYSVMKSVRTSILEGYFDIPEDGQLCAYLQGKRSTHDDWLTLISNCFTNVPATFKVIKDFIALAISDTEINLYWTYPYSGFQNFQLQYSTDEVIWKTLAVLDNDVFDYEHTGLTEDTTYYYRIRVNGGDWSEVVSVDLSHWAIVSGTWDDTGWWYDGETWVD